VWVIRDCLWMLQKKKMKCACCQDWSLMSKSGIKRVNRVRYFRRIGFFFKRDFRQPLPNGCLCVNVVAAEVILNSKTCDGSCRMWLMVHVLHIVWPKWLNKLNTVHVFKDHEITFTRLTELLEVICVLCKFFVGYFV